MAGVTIEIRTDALKRALKAVESACRDLTPAWRQVGEHMLRSVRANFEAGGRPEKWDRTKNATLVARFGKNTHTKKGAVRVPIARKVEHEKPLVHTSRLLNSIGYQAWRLGTLIGTSVIYAAIHQFGGRTAAHVIRAKKGKALAWAGAAHPVKSVNHPGSVLPPRPFLVVQDEDERIIAGILERHIAEPIR